MILKNILESYLISLPSGEIIDIDNQDIFNLKRINLIKFDNDLFNFVCNDSHIDLIKMYLHQIKCMFSKEEIIEFLIECGLLRDQFRIFDDLSVDVYAPLNISYKKLFKIPIKFNRVCSDFDCSFNRLLTLENSPFTVHGKFNCSYNYLDNLIGGPRLVSKSYICCNNGLVSLKGAPNKVISFNCSNNDLYTLKYAPNTEFFTYLNNPINEKR